MKITKGVWRGRKIAVPPQIRPLTTRVRESCLDLLGPQLEGVKVLDLFAGSGALGLEALSCGAAACTFVDISKKATEAIKANLGRFKAGPANKVYLGDSFNKIKAFCQGGQRFDLVFLDPPYYKGLLKKVLPILEEYDILTPLGLLVGFCYSKDEVARQGKRFSLILEKKYGQTLLLIYKKQ